MKIPAQIYRHVAGITPKWEQDYSPKWVSEAIARAGGVSQLARAIGVQRTTVQRWNKGATPTIESQELLRTALRTSRLSTGREGRLRASDALILRGDQDGRKRVIDVGQYLAPGTMDRAVTAYLRGASPTELAAIVSRGVVGAPFYKALIDPYRGRRAPAHGAPAAGPRGGGGGGGGGGGAGGDDDLGDEEDEYDEEYIDDGYQGEDEYAYLDPDYDMT